MIGSTVSSETSRRSSVFASWVAPQMLASVEYAFSCESRYGQLVLGEPGAHLVPSAELADEVRVQPRLVDPQRRVGEQPVPVEALDVVALEGRAVAPDVDAVVVHRAHEQRPGHGPAQRGGVEVGAATAADVERPADQRGEPFLHQRLVQSTTRASSAPYCSARSGTPAMSGSSYWPMSAV
jgi:hypothetical protein